MVAILTNPPAQEPVTLDEAKAHARIDGAAEDGTLATLIAAARTHVEQLTGRALVTQGWRLVHDGVPEGGIVRLAPAPVISVDEVSVYGEDGTRSVVAPQDYAVDLVRGRLKLASGRFWGARAMNGLEVDLTCGYGAPEAVPAPLRLAVLMLTAYWFEQREAATIGAVTEPVAKGIASLTASYRMPRFA